MNRSLRTFIVVAIGLTFAAFATYLVYSTIKNRPVAQVEVQTFAVVAAHPLALGARLAATDVKLVPWPPSALVPGGFATIDDVVDRGLIAPVAENEPLTGNNVAPKASGVGLPPTIPTGMRAISVKVDEVVGVAGFVVPGTRVDVMVILREANSALARVVVSNVQVLAAGTKLDQDTARDGKAIPSSVVTLMVSPEDAEKVGLASNEGRILLTLRNPMDAAPTVSPGTRTANLMGGSVAPAPAPAAASSGSDRPRRQSVAPPPPPPPAPVSKIYSVEVIRGAKRTEEIIK